MKAELLAGDNEDVSRPLALRTPVQRAARRIQGHPGGMAPPPGKTAAAPPERAPRAVRAITKLICTARLKWRFGIDARVNERVQVGNTWWKKYFGAGVASAREAPRRRGNHHALALGRDSRRTSTMPNETNSNAAMDTRRLAGNGPPITRFGLGMAALGRPAYITLGHAGDFPGGRDVGSME